MFFYAPFNKDLGLFCIRVGIGLIFIMHGWSKLAGGPEAWTGLGMSMQHLGIAFMPMVWGLIAACVEFFGGIALVTGFGIRWASALMACVMMVALVMHVKNGDSFTVFAHPLSLLCVFVGLLIAGGGSYKFE